MSISRTQPFNWPIPNLSIGRYSTFQLDENQPFNQPVHLLFGLPASKLCSTPMLRKPSEPADLPDEHPQSLAEAGR